MEYFKDIIDQPVVKDRIKKNFLNNRFAHAYLFYGPEGGGKESFALEIAKSLNCLNESEQNPVMNVRNLS